MQMNIIPDLSKIEKLNILSKYPIFEENFRVGGNPPRCVTVVLDMTYDQIQEFYDEKLKENVQLCVATDQ